MKTPEKAPSLHQKEDFLKHKLREQLAELASLWESAVSILVLIGLLLSAVPLVVELPKLLDPTNDLSFQIYLGHAFTLVIGVEFIKMLAKHTPGSALEVLLYTIARHMIIGSGGAVDNLISLCGIALIFVIRKFCFVPAFGSTLPDGRPAPDVPDAPAAKEGEDASRSAESLF